jgi:Ceramidase
MSCNPYQQFFGINEGAIGGISPDFAENNLCGYIAQPANVISSLAYIIAGIYLYHKTKNTLNSILIVLLGIGSIALHSTVTRIGQIMDFGFMFLIMMYFLYKILKTSTTLKSKVIQFIICILTIIETLVLIFAIRYRIAILSIISLLILVIETRSIISNKLDYKLWLRSWIMFIIFFIIWLLDEYRIWDFDSIEHLFNAHALWHLGTAYCLYTISIYLHDKGGLKKVNKIEVKNV